MMYPEGSLIDPIPGMTASTADNAASSKTTVIMLRSDFDALRERAERAEAQLADAATRIAESDAENDGLRGCIAQGRGMNIFIESSDRDASPTPCQKCGEEVFEFSIPNRLWNKVVRPDGHEQDKEYFCIRCFYDMTFEWMERAENDLNLLKENPDLAAYFRARHRADEAEEKLEKMIAERDAMTERANELMIELRDLRADLKVQMLGEVVRDFIAWMNLGESNGEIRAWAARMIAALDGGKGHDESH